MSKLTAIHSQPAYKPATLVEYNKKQQSHVTKQHKTHSCVPGGAFIDSRAASSCLLAASNSSTQNAKTQTYTITFGKQNPGKPTEKPEKYRQKQRQTKKNTKTNQSKDEAQKRPHSIYVSRYSLLSPRWCLH
jgi:hypothetical protein